MTPRPLFKGSLALRQEPGPGFARDAGPLSHRQTTYSMAAPEALLLVEGLVKSYKKRRVVDGVGFGVDKGEIVGLLGPNGAGKTTSFRMTVGLVPPDRGPPAEVVRQYIPTP